MPRTFGQTTSLFPLDYIFPVVTAVIEYGREQ